MAGITYQNECQLPLRPYQAGALPETFRPSLFTPGLPGLANFPLPNFPGFLSPSVLTTVKDTRKQAKPDESLS